MLFCQAQMAKQQAQTQMTKTQLNSIEKDEEELKTKVKSLEMYLNNSAPNSIKELKVNLKIIQCYSEVTHHYKNCINNFYFCCFFTLDPCF